MNSPPLPEGWQARWDEQSNQWYYFHFASGVSQWQNPGAAEQPVASHGVSPDAQAQPSEQSRGFFSDAASGLAAGALFDKGRAEFKEHQNHHDHHDHFHMPGLETMAGFLGMAGAGAKLFGKKQHSQSPPPQTATQPQQPTYAPVPVPVPVPVPFPVPTHQYSPPPPHQYTPPPPPPMASPPMPSPPGPGVSYPAPPPVTQFMGRVPTGPVAGKPPLIIHAAAFAGADVTRSLQALVTADQAIELKGADLIGYFGDPWPESGRYRPLVVLYQYGERPMEACAAMNNAPKIEITLQPLITERMKWVNSSQSRIVCLVWGQKDALTVTRAEKLDKEGELETSELGDNCGHFIGTGGMEALPVLTCFYRNDFGGLSVGSARFGGTMRLPWNPLAKWN